MIQATQHEKARYNRESVQEVSKSLNGRSDLFPATTDQVAQTLLKSSETLSEEKAEVVGRTNLNYWKSRLYRNTFTWHGKQVRVKRWCVKIQHLGCRKTFSLESANKDVAAAKARDIYLAVVGKGWAAAEAIYNPEMLARKDDPTLGDFLAEVENKASLKAKTLRNYASSFRTIVSGIIKAGADKTKYDYRSGGHEGWRSRVDAVRLSAITPDKVQAWKIAYFKTVDCSPTAQASARRTVNSYIRCARSLFSPGVLKFVKVRLPDPLPFDGIELEENGSMRYKSRIDPELLVVEARKELHDRYPESYKAFLLALLSGLRRSEIDMLQWDAIDWSGSRIWIGTTEHFDVKTEDSEDFVEVDAEVLDELRKFKKSSQSQFVLTSELPPRVGLDRQYYRCQSVFQHLIGWLRGKGISSNKPLHELRKEFGSLVNQKHGIYAASRALRHSDITTSTRHYVAKKERVTVGLGHLLAQPAVPKVARKKTRKAKRRQPKKVAAK